MRRSWTRWRSMMISTLPIPRCAAMTTGAKARPGPAEYLSNLAWTSGASAYSPPVLNPARCDRPRQRAPGRRDDPPGALRIGCRRRTGVLVQRIWTPPGRCTTAILEEPPDPGSAVPCPSVATYCDTTMSALVLSTMANSSSCSASGTPNLSTVFLNPSGH